MKVEGAAAGYYVAALFESARPGHRGLNTARLARDARAGALARLRLARFTVGRWIYPRLHAPWTNATELRPARQRGRRRVRGKPRPAEAA